MVDAGIAPGSEAHASLDPTRCGVIVGTALGGAKIFENSAADLREKGPRKISPFTIPFFLSNMASGILAMEKDVGFRGPTYSINTACATANYCYIAAADHIRRGEADIILAGGTEACVTPMGMAGFIACKALSARNHDPTRASRPWDKNRDGFVMGEGAAVLAMESLAHAKARGAPILAEFLGGGISNDAYDLTAPRPDGEEVIRCLNNALKNSNITAADVDLVNAHGTSTPVGDAAEIVALAAVFGPHAHRVKVHSTKSMTGHSLGAAGALEAVAVLKAIETGMVHPTINHDDPLEGLPFDVVPNTLCPWDVKIALSNSFGFGGHNSSVVFARYEE